MGEPAPCGRCEVIHESPCPRCGCQHHYLCGDESCGIVHLLACGSCKRWHTPSVLAVGQSCCLRGLDADHVCGRATAGTFCRSCEAATADAVAELPDLYVDLYLALEGTSAPLERRPPGFESVVPIRVAVADLMADLAGYHPDGRAAHAGSDHVAGVLASWEDALRDHLGFARRPARRLRPLLPAEEAYQRMAQAAAFASYTAQSRAQQTLAEYEFTQARMHLAALRRRRVGEVEAQAGPTISMSARFLHAHLTALLAYAPEAGDELLRLRLRALRLLDRDRSGDFEKLPDAPCPYCGTRTLFREYGSDRVRCGSERPHPDLTALEYRRLTYFEERT